MTIKVALINSVPPDEGVGRYVRSLHRVLNTIPSVQATEYYINKIDIELIRRGPDGLVKTISLPNRLLQLCKNISRVNDRFSRLVAIFSLARFIPNSYDLYHIADQNMADLAYYDAFSPSVVTVHDLVWLTHPTGPMDKFLGRVLFRGVSAADRLITISEFTKKDLLRFYPSAQSKTTLVYNGVDQRYREVSDRDITKIHRKYDMDNDHHYLLHLGTDKPTKNVKTLLDILKNLPSNVKLIRTKSLPNSESYAESIGVSEKIQNIGFVAHENLPALYAGVDLYITTSKYEGFGLPPLEAMAAGTPVVASNAASLPEIVGEAGIVCDPEDTEQYVLEINNLVNNSTKQHRLEDKGQRRAQKFSWDLCGQKTLDVYKSVLNTR